jgi:hypothetical protein
MTATVMCVTPQTRLRRDTTVQHLADVLFLGIPIPIIILIALFVH